MPLSSRAITVAGIISTRRHQHPAATSLSVISLSDLTILMPSQVSSPTWRIENPAPVATASRRSTAYDVKDPPKRR
ncbi:hypothetical protein AG1IA_05587 [Rhizoctonia solani AG-1 IA]|uniref:Uncharacterized protein n=1 Tax=Thanatephorus cucumeris (strain AG1-IA) TaxID=983506 RepID=L8WUD8_THACA|nr:hypothetical protein AG1IA_05587 [Rhizoctonia solani AG-1 IA]